MKRLFCFFLLCVAPVAMAQEACPVFDEALVETLKTQCRSLAVGEGCTPNAETLLLRDESISAPALVKVSGGLTLAVMGDATLTPVESPIMLVSVTNANSFELNLRQGAGRDFALAGTLPAGAVVEADGKSADGQWFHLVQGAWVFAELVVVGGDLDTLIVKGNDEASVPLSEFALVSSGGCNDSGVLFSVLGEAEITLNSVSIQANGATVFVGISDQTSELEIIVTEGDVVVSLLDEPETLVAGESLIMTADGLERVEIAETRLESLPFALVIVDAGTPEDVVYRYLEARTRSSSADMQDLSCAAWDLQAMIQSQSFRAMNAELKNVNCLANTTTDTAQVSCEGVIQTTYNGQNREWALRGFELTQEEGEWRICGELN